MKQKRSIKFKVVALLAGLLVIAIAGLFIFISTSYKASPSAEESLQSDGLVNVMKDGEITFEPVSNPKDIGYIFYPGAKVEAPAYATMAREIAEKGYPVILADLTFNLAILSPNRADEIIENHPDVKRWIIGGHSLGGVMASDYALKNNKVEGLILLASYPQSKTDLSKSPLKVLSLWGSNDEVADLEKVKNAKKGMPNDAQFIEIKGGNHGGFGEYGHQKGDGVSTLLGNQQIEEAVKQSIEFLDHLSD